MNPRRIHMLMREHFPTVNTVEHEWINVADTEGLREAELQELLSKFFEAPELLVKVHRRIGKLLPKAEVTAFIAEHLGQGQIKIADRQFTAFALIAVNGVATAWLKPQCPDEVAKMNLVDIQT
jgi:hypothetical protein